MKIRVGRVTDTGETLYTTENLENFMGITDPVKFYHEDDKIGFGKRKNRKNPALLLNKLGKSEVVFSEYTRLRAEPENLTDVAALEGAAKWAGVCESYAQVMLAHVRARMARRAALDEAMARGVSRDDLAAIMRCHEKGSRPRGRKPKA